MNQLARTNVLNREESERGTELPIIAGAEPRLGASTSSYYLRLIWRARWQILALVTLVTVVATLAALALPKMYEGDATVRVDPMGVQVAGQDSRNLDRSDSQLLLETERNVITSPAILVDVIRQLNLDQDPEFLATGADANARMDSLVRQVAKNLAVDSPVGTLLLSIHFRSRQPQLAANAANAIVSSFIDHEYQSRADALHESSKYMSAQLGDMRAAMEHDQQALVNYQSNNDVLDPEDKQNIYAARLSQVNADLSAAQSARMQAQALYEAASNGEVDALIAAGAGQSLVPIRQRLRDDTRQLARLGAVYGDRHPVYREQQQLVSQDQTALSLAAGQESVQLTAKLQAAQIRERLLHADLAQEKQAMDEFNQRAIRYSALKAASDSSSKLYYDLLQQIQTNNVTAGLKNETLRVVSLARVPDRPVFPRVLLTAGLAFTFSLLLGIWGCIGLALLDRSVARPEDVEQLFHLPVLGSIPLRPVAMLATQAGESRGSPFEEAILSLRSVLMFTLPTAGAVVAVTSAVPGEGKSTIAASIARALAASGRSVVLVDCDLRKPSVHRTMQIENRRGLGGVLLGRLDLHAATVVPPGQTLAVLPAGADRVPTALLHSELEKVIGQLRQQFDFVVLDCPPTLGFSDVAPISRLADGLLVVVHAGKTERNLLQAALRQLSATAAPILGVVLNRVSSNIDEYYGYYSEKGYQHYYQEEEV